MGSQTGRTSPTCRTCLTRPRPNTDSCPFAFFVNIRGLKISIEFPLFSSHEAHKAAHERERAIHPAFLRANTIRLSADFLIASADSIRKPADTIRKMTKRIRKIFIKSSRKNTKIPQNLHFPQDFARLFPPTKSKMPQRFWQKAKRRAFLNFSEEGLLSIFQEVLELFGLVGQVGQVGKVVKRAAYRPSQTHRPLPTCQTCPTSQKVAAEHSPLWGRWRGLFLCTDFTVFSYFCQQKQNHTI